jgi:O-methyltransferase domain/Dimerisation domain
LSAGEKIATADERAAARELLPMIWGIHISRCVYAAAELGIADLLADGPQSSAELAAKTSTHEPSLYRVLRVLAALGVFEEHGSGRFSLTLVGERLRTGAAAGLRSWSLFLEATGGVRPFAHILETVRTGRSGVEIEFGEELFDFIAKDPAAGAVFDAAMAERTTAYAPSVAEVCDFSHVRKVIDVGGGNGTLLVEILRRHDHVSGVLFESPTVAARATAVSDATDLVDRCQVLAGDFFTSVPEADCYVLANVLHDWDDARSIKILNNCRQAMSGSGRILIVERLIPENGGDSLPTLLSDINMLVLTGGQERTNEQYRALLAAAGLRLSSVTPVAFPYAVIQGAAA